jgi:hypothetical protein
MYNPIKHILPMTMIRRERVLPSPGKVVVRAGQKLGAADVVAEAHLYPEYLLLDVARGLGVAAEKADALIQCQVGDTIAAGDIVAGPVGLSRRVIRSPKDGKAALVGSGQVLLELASRPFQVRAGIPGDVVELIPDYGAVIETGGALVQGVWGNGLVEFGALRVLAKSADGETTADELDVSQRGAIVLAGYCASEEVLRAAEALPLRGLILPGMDAALAPAAARLSFPVIVLEGFGQTTYNPAAFKLLTTNEGRSAAVNAEVGSGYNGKRPEVVIPLPVPGSVAPPPEIAPLAANTSVRVLRAPAAGQIGQVVSIKRKVALPSGVRAPAAEVRLENGQMVVVPLANLEIIA